LVAQALDWAGRTDPDYRVAGVSIFGLFPPSPEAERAIRVGLTDAHAHDVLDDYAFDPADRGRRTFPVREAAVRTLRAWERNTGARPHAWLGTDRQDDLFHEAYPRYAPIRAGGAVVVGAIAVVGLAACCGRRRPRIVRTALGLGLLCATATAASMAWRSSTTVDWVTWASSPAQWEVVSSGGRLAVVRLDSPPAGWTIAPAAPLIASYTPAAIPRRQDRQLTAIVPALELKTDDAAGGRWGPVRASRGLATVDLTTINGKVRTRQFAYAIVVVPWGGLAILPALPLVLAGMIALRRKLRRRARVKRGRCAHCGYDLRGGARAAGRRCPECGGRGVVVVRRAKAVAY
ncbi:MAG TPA: hypothetical protein VEA69_11170, partial [Tepidisphaeraceae bacterium]|nr:hypothetical protein [Tepidisphaeraceae bacterium]